MEENHVNVTLQMKTSTHKQLLQQTFWHKNSVVAVIETGTETAVF